MGRGSKRVREIVFLALTTLVLNFSDRATADTAIATGTNPSICNQTVGNNALVSIVRDSSGDCIMTFNSAGSNTTWFVPSNLNGIPIQVLAVGAGGGGEGGEVGFSQGQSGCHGVTAELKYQVRMLLRD